MSTPTSTIQLLGGLLSVAPSNAANGMLSMNNQGAAPVADAFYSLWVGLTQSAPLDSSLANAERQASVDSAQLDGSILPLNISPDALKQLENLIQSDDINGSEALDDVLDLLRSSLQSLFSQMESQDPAVLASLEKQNLNRDIPSFGLTLKNPANESDALLENLELSDEQLLAYLQLLRQQLTQQQESLENAAALDESNTNSPATILSLLAGYLEQKIAANTDGKDIQRAALTDVEQKSAEQRMNQLWAQLEAARTLREEETKLSSSGRSLDESALITSKASDSANEPLLEQVEAQRQEIAQREALASAELSKEASSQLVEEQGRNAIADLQTQQNASVSPLVVPVIAPTNSTAQVKNDKSLDRAPESRINLTPLNPVTGAPTTELTPAERLAASEVSLDGGRRVLTDAINQAIAQRNTVEDAASDTLRRQEAASSSTALLSDTQKISQSLASPVQAPIAQAQNSQDALMQKMLNPQWSRALGERAVMMAQQGPRLAEVRLDPPELGSLRIKVQVHANDQVSLTFNAPNASVREVLEQSLPRLREMFAEQGMNLADASVSDQSKEQSSEQAHARSSGRGESSAGDDFGELPASRTELRKVGIIDYYA